PVAGPLLIPGEAGIELGGEVPEALPTVALRLGRPVAAATPLGPELDLRIGAYVVVPGRMVAVPSPRGDQDHVVAVGEVRERRRPLLAALRAGVGQQDGRGAERAPHPAAGRLHQVRVDLVAD